MEAERLRAWWFHRQGLDGRLAGQAPAAALALTGWARSVGATSPYLGLRARTGAGREAIDRAVAALEIHELPAARGCTYVVPAPAFPLALRLSRQFGPEADMKVARKLGVADDEIDRLCVAVVDALRDGQLDPDDLRAATGGASRSLGEAGKKRGLSTTLPLALGRLQAEGEIRRVPINGRLDQQRYRYTLWRPNPLDGYRLSIDECYAELARLFFTWIAPAAMAEFQAFAALGVKAAKAAAEPLDLVSLGPGDRRLILPWQRDEIDAFAVPPEPCYALVGSIDGMLLLRRDVQSLLDPADRSKPVAGDKGIFDASGMIDLPSHAILDRGRLVGFWEYDPEAQEIVWTTFIPPTTALRDAIGATEAFIRSDLGDVRAFSLDSPKSRLPRLQTLRSLRPAAG
jgi:hypothetical protein